MDLLAAVVGSQTSVAHSWDGAVYRGEFWPWYHGDRCGEVCRWTERAASLAQVFAAMAGWLALASPLIFLPLAVMALAAAVHIAWGGAIAPSPASGHVLLVVVNFGLVLLLGGPLGEEFGWRGYALPVLQERYSWRIASLVLGMVWGAWHLPLFYIADTAQSHLPVGLFMVSTVALSVLFTWLFNHTGSSVLPALVLHTAVNAWAWVIPVMVMPDGSNLRPYGLAVGLLVLIALGLLCDAEPHLPLRSPKSKSGSR